MSKSKLLTILDAARAAAGSQPTSYRYAATLRPPGFATVPEGFVMFESHPAFRHGLVIYDRQLTPEEAEHFSLLYLPEGPEIDKIARQIAEQIRYPSQTLQLASEDPKFFEMTIGRELDKRGIYVEGGREALAILALDALRARLERS